MHELMRAASQGAALVASACVCDVRLLHIPDEMVTLKPLGSVASKARLPHSVW